jgi:2-oxoglutarate dehydrogenase E1 component
MSCLPAYEVGGTINIIVNNLLGFTTNPSDYASGRYASDLAKRLPIPIFHVNAEDPEAVVRIGRLALEYRYQFGSDVLIDLIGYRRHGHSEIDDPTITQPLMYAKIKAHAPLYEIYAKRLGIDVTGQVAESRERYQQAKVEAKSMTKKPKLYKLPDYWDGYFGGKWSPGSETDTGVAEEDLTRLGTKLGEYPAEFHIHPKARKWRRASALSTTEWRRRWPLPALSPAASRSGCADRTRAAAPSAIVTRISSTLRTRANTWRWRTCRLTRP